MPSNGIPRPEFPRPERRREDWLNLNGPWRFRFDPGDQGRAETWQHAADDEFDRVILVPFPWESRLSGIEAADTRGVAWYRRAIAVPAEWTGRRVFLCFGAVDYDCRVWLDDAELGGHEGGYTPFEFELTGLVQPGAAHRVTLRVDDPTSGEQPAGKQLHWYTPSSGIWQTVWLEARGEAWIRRLEAATLDDRTGVAIRFDLDAPASFDGEAVLSFDDADLPDCILPLPPGCTRAEAHIRPPRPELWSPESPRLYPYSLTLRAGHHVTDRVHSYFAIRTVAVGKWGDDPTPRILLNGRPVYVRATLNQAFHPDCLYTYPSDEAIRRDIEANRDYGFNAMRIHIKVDDPRVYYWADQLGCLILYDFPNCWTWSETAAARWEQTFREALERDRGHPCILFWVLFNETWGLMVENVYGPRQQAWVESMVRLARSLDPSRPIEDNSPCRYDHAVTDINSWHFYESDIPRAAAQVREAAERTAPGSAWNFVAGRTQDQQPLLNSEYGSVGCNNGDQDIAFGFKALTNLLRAEPKIQGYVYTELMDIEWEHNGFLDYDRTPKAFGYGDLAPGMTPADLNAPDAVIPLVLPVASAVPGQALSVPVAVSHYSPLEDDRVFVVAGAGWETETESHPVREIERREMAWRPCGVQTVEPFAIPMPDENSVAAVVFRLERRTGEILARNLLEVDVFGSPRPAAEVLPSGTVRLRCEPEDLRLLEGARDTERLSPGVLRFRRGAVLEAVFTLPEGMDAAGLRTMTLHLEASAYAPDRRLDWPRRPNPADYPQTGPGRISGAVRIAVGNSPRIAPLADMPSDIRGILSNAHLKDWRGYGERITVGMDLDPVAREQLTSERRVRVRLETPADAAESGLAIYGSRTGRYPLGIVLDLE